MKNNYLFLFILSFSLCKAYGQNVKELSKSITQDEKEQSVIDYSNIKSVLKNDGLLESQNKKKQYLKRLKKERNSLKVSRYQYPSDNDYWKLMSQMWLVKNAQQLNWDFPKPEYGIGRTFKGLLEQLGYFNQSFKVLILNTPTVVHFGIPAGKDEHIFILSLPFIRSLDLTKVDISLILLEDFFRLQSRSFINNLKINLDFLGTSFYGQTFNKQSILTTQKRYSEVILKEGYTFQQQYEITKKMDSVLKSDPKLWAVYFRLISKIDRYIKNDLLYKKYLKIYPSPELQLQWLSPKKKVI